MMADDQKEGGEAGMAAMAAGLLGGALGVCTAAAGVLIRALDGQDRALHGLPLTLILAGAAVIFVSAWIFIYGS